MSKLSLHTPHPNPTPRNFPQPVADSGSTVPAARVQILSVSLTPAPAHMQLATKPHGLHLPNVPECDRTTTLTPTAAFSVGNSGYGFKSSVLCMALLCLPCMSPRVTNSESALAHNKHAVAVSIVQTPIAFKAQLFKAFRPHRLLLSFRSTLALLTNPVTFMSYATHCGYVMSPPASLRFNVFV